MTSVPITPKVMDAIARGEVKGMIPTIEITHDQGKMDAQLVLTPWWTSPLQRERGTGKIRWHPKAQPGHAAPMPPEAVARMQARTLPERRTSARQKLAEFTLRMLEEGRRFTKDGVLTWPQSIQTKLIDAGCTPANNLVKEVETLTRLFMVESANRQKAHDRKQVTKDWHGHTAA